MDCAKMWSEGPVIKYTIKVASTEEKTWMRILAYQGLWNLLGYGYWAIEEKSSGRFIGEMGSADFHRVLTPSINGIPEMGWALIPSAHGKGYATEGCQAVMSWGIEHLRCKKAVCLIHPKNVSSIKVAEKCGFKNVLGTKLNDVPKLLFERNLKEV